jgi:hypothetical protein
MNYDRAEASLTTHASRPRPLLAEIMTGALLLGSIVIAVLQPAWLTVPLHSAVENAGAAAPILFVLLCAIAAPLHLNGVLVALSTLFWPLPIAGALSFTGSVSGCVLSAVLLSRLTGAALERWSNGSTMLRRLSKQVAQRPVFIGIVARIAIGSGLALEAFYILTHYTRRQYLIVSVVGVAFWVTQALVGVIVLQSLSHVSPWLTVIVSLVAPLLGVVGMLVMHKRRQQRSR